MDALSAWLRELDLERYAQVFADHDVDLKAVRLLTDADMVSLGISLGHRRVLLKAIAELNASLAPAPTVQPIQESPTARESVSPEAERRQLTVLFCDLVGSTALAQKLDPEELRDLMQAYQRACRDVITRYEGHVAQYLGDGLMVYFGWPRAHEDDAVRAIRAGLEVTQAVSKLTASTPISARVGVHTGVVVVGETGHGDASIPKAAVGDTPNIAARLQGLADAGSVVVSARTQALAAGLFDYADLDSHTLKGVSEPMRLFKVVGSRSTESRFEASRSALLLTPLVGREEEIALLLRRWQQAKEGEGQVVLVGGEPGIGKSRLTRVLRERLGQERYLVLRYQCSPYNLNSALYPAIEQFERAAGFTREDTPEQKLDKMQALLAGSEQQVAEAAPLFAALLSLPVDRYPPLNLSPQKQKEKTLEALAGQIEALAKQEPVLMIYEDVHWLDATSQEVLDLLVPRLRELPVLMIVTYRPEYSPRWTDQAHVTLLSLNRLGRRQGAELVAKVTGGKALPQEVLDQIVAHTDGVPLFIEELTKSVLESKLLRAQGDRYMLDGPLPALAIPTTLRDSLIARLDRLAPVREVAQIGACIGREFSYELLAVLSPLKDARLEEALEQLTKTGLVFRRGTPPDATYTFKHALVQDAAYDSLLKSKRAQLHAQIAEALERGFPQRVANEPELVAHHYTAADMPKQAVPYWQRAAERALARSAPTEAIAHCRKGLQVLAALPETPERTRSELGLQLGLGSGLVQVKGWAAPDAEQAYLRAQTLCQEVDDPSLLIPTLFGLGGFFNVSGQHRVSRDLARRALAVAERAGDAAATVHALYFVGDTSFWNGDLMTSRSSLERSLDLYNVERDRSNLRFHGFDSRVNALNYLAHPLWFMGYPDQAGARIREALTFAERLSQPFGLALAEVHDCFLRSFTREWSALEAAARTLRTLSAEQSFGLLLVWADTFIAITVGQRGRWAEGLEQIEQGLVALRNLGTEMIYPEFLAFVAEAHLHLQRPAEGFRTIADMRATIERGGERIFEPEAHRLEGELFLLDRPDPARAQACFLRGIDVARELRAKSSELRCAASLACLWRDQGKHKQAHDLLAPIYGWFTEGFDTPDLTQAKALLDELS